MPADHFEHSTVLISSGDNTKMIGHPFGAFDNSESSRCNSVTSLGNWVTKQRFRYKLYREGKQSPVTTERIRELESVGFEWETPSAAEVWSLAAVSRFITDNTWFHFAVLGRPAFLKQVFSNILQHKIPSYRDTPGAVLIKHSEAVPRVQLW